MWMPHKLVAHRSPVALVLAWYHGDRAQKQITRIETAILTALFLLGGGVSWYFQRTSDGLRASGPNFFRTARRTGPRRVPTSHAYRRTDAGDGFVVWL